MAKIKVLPAHAGVIPQRNLLSVTTTSFTRTRGGDPDGVKLFILKLEVLPAHAGVIPR